MGWETIFEDTQFSVQIAPQGTDLNTAGSSWTVVECEMPQVNFDTQQYDAPRSVASWGAGTIPKPGREWPRLALKFAVPGQKSAYAFASDTPDWAGLMGLFQFAMTNVAQTYIANEITLAGSDANTIVCATAAADIGALLAMRDASDGLCNMGWVKSNATFTATLTHDLGIQPANQAARLASTTLCPQQVSETDAASAYGYTIKVTGEDVRHNRSFIGFVPSSIELTVENDQLMAMVEGVAYGGMTEATTGGGLVALTGALDMESVLARGGGRYVLHYTSSAYNFNSDANDGTVDPDGTCDIRDLSLKITLPHHIVTAPSGTQGVNKVVVRSPTFEASFALPNIDTYSGGADGSLLESVWREGRTANLARLSINAYYGNEAGKLFAWRIPDGFVPSRPERVFIDGVEFQRGVLRAGTRTLDTAGTDAENRVFTMARA